MKLLAIDPGNIESAYVVLDKDYCPIQHEKVRNEYLLDTVLPALIGEVTDVAVEMVASYGMAVGREVFDTCVWIGRFLEACRQAKNKLQIYRMDEKVNLCHDSRAKDSNIRQALIDRFGVVGTKKNPGFFYGFSKDQWAAMAVGVTYLDMKRGAYVRRNPT